jgi:AcrR family transcriptional regulator
VPKAKKRVYRSPVRERQAVDTRQRIIDATRQLLSSRGYAGMTVDEIARRAEVSPQSVYAIFKSKTGILVELLDQAAFGADYQQLVQQALNTSDPEARLRFAARIARQIHHTQSTILDLLRGAAAVAPDLSKFERQRECVRYERQESTAQVVRDSGRLRPELSYQTARDVFWTLTGRDLYRMLVRNRGWSPDQYEEWLGRTLVESLLTPKSKRR